MELQESPAETIEILQARNAILEEHVAHLSRELARAQTAVQMTAERNGGQLRSAIDAMDDKAEIATLKSELIRMQETSGQWKAAFMHMLVGLHNEGIVPDQLQTGIEAPSGDPDEENLMLLIQEVNRLVKLGADFEKIVQAIHKSDTLMSIWEMLIATMRLTGDDTVADE